MGPYELWVLCWVMDVAAGNTPPLLFARAAGRRVSGDGIISVCMLDSSAGMRVCV